ncbi:MAG: M28 family metallopeptidase [Betaproteobacteria bacterium]
MSGSAMERDWQHLIDLGPRFMGQPAAAQAADFVLARLAAAGCQAFPHGFAYEGWRLSGTPRLSLLAPVEEQWEAYPFLLSGSTAGAPGGRIRGTLVYLGKYNVWGMYDWDKFAVIGPDGRTLAYISGRPGGPAIPQVLSPGSSRLPHLIVGETDLARLHRWRGQGTEIRVEVESHTEYLPGERGINAVGRFPSSTPDQGPRVIVTAHFDTMYNTAGAYDNASGTAVLLELARRLAERPPACSVDFVGCAAEEWNLAGSTAYVQDLRAKGHLNSVKAVVNLDGFGRGDELEVWSGPEPFEVLLRSVLAPLTGDGQRPKLLYKFPPPPGSDHAPFYAAGIPVCMLTFNDQQILHRPEDQRHERMWRNMAATADLAEALVRTLCGSALQLERSV